MSDLALAWNALAGRADLSLDAGALRMEDGLRTAVILSLMTDGRARDHDDAVLRRWFGDVQPAATMQQCALIDPAMRIEIEATAYRG